MEHPGVAGTQKVEEREMNREKAIQVLRMLDYRLSDVTYEESLAIGVAVKALINETPSDRWIPCAERLPERAGIYLITYKESSEHLGIEWERDVCRARFTKLGWTFNRMACRNVLAWQDLPQPWKGE